ncbi:MAG: nucleoside phosphorylase [Candidatus Lokiarchaeota archaeon]|nr:nucleoside phosphorylase [Candidatus Lokiarchaeota archaeon]
MVFRDIPLIEYDPERISIINPLSILDTTNVPERCIIPFYGSLLTEFERMGHLHKLVSYNSTVMEEIHLYEMHYKGERIAVMSPGFGAPFAAGNLELAIAMGCKKFIVIGSGGVLNESIARNKLIVLSSAIRDEGTSYHYLPPSREVEANPAMIMQIQEFLVKTHVDHLVGKTWTTDAFFRETPNKIKARKAEGAICVEMESSALMAVAQFRKVDLGFILAAGDDVSGLTWDQRQQTKNATFPERFFWLAADICLTL